MVLEIVDKGVRNPREVIRAATCCRYIQLWYVSG